MLIATNITQRYVCFVQVPAAKSRLRSGDVFILDMGLKVYQWNGSSASVFEKHKVVSLSILCLLSVIK